MTMFKLAKTRLLKLPIYLLALPVILIIRMISPWYLVRFETLISPRIGHFAANTEIYLCERDAGINVPQERHVDLFYLQSWPPVCNEQLARMWKRVLHIWPTSIVSAVVRLNRLLPGWEHHEIGQNTQSDRDVFNLLDRSPPHLEFTDEEEKRGAEGLRQMGIPVGAPFICLNVRDSIYLNAQLPGKDWSYHNYRNSDIQNYTMAAEAIADRGFFVIRMGAKVRDAIKTSHPRVIDYASNGSRSDFLDIFLGAKCAFCISDDSGYSSVPVIFRRPMVYVNYVPIGTLYTFSKNFLCIPKHHVPASTGRKSALSEIFSSGAGFCGSTSEFNSKQIQLVENTPEEIRDAAMEMFEHLNGNWQISEEDRVAQEQFWQLYKHWTHDSQYAGQPLHGELRARIGANFLRANPNWLE